MADATIFDRLKQDHDAHRQLLAKMDDAADEPDRLEKLFEQFRVCLLYTSPSPRDVEESRMPSSA